MHKVKGGVRLFIDKKKMPFIEQSKHIASMIEDQQDSINSPKGTSEVRASNKAEKLSFNDKYAASLEVQEDVLCSNLT